MFYIRSELPFPVIWTASKWHLRTGPCDLRGRRISTFSLKIFLTFFLIILNEMNVRRSTDFYLIFLN